MAAVELVPALREHIEPLCQNVRQKDREEVYAAGGWTIHEAAGWAFENSLYMSTILHNGEPVAMMGVTPYTYLSEIGVPWMIATVKVKKIPIQFLKISKRFIDAVSLQFPRLLNYVDVRHSEAIKYLEALGFTVYEPEPYGFLGLPFRRFELCVIPHS